MSKLLPNNRTIEMQVEVEECDVVNDITEEESSKERSFLYSVVDGDVDAVRRMLERGDIDVDEHNFLYVKCAVEQRNAEILDVILTYAGHKTSACGGVAFEFMATGYHSVDPTSVLDVLIDHMIRVPRSQAYSMLFCAITVEHIELFRSILIDHDSILQDAHCDMETLWGLAISCGNIHFTHMLLNWGTPPICDLQLHCPMKMAIEFPRIDVIDALLDFEIKITVPYSEVLAEAALSGNTAVLETIEEAGPNHPSFT